MSLPTNKDVARILSTSSNHIPQDEEDDRDAIEVGQLYVTLIAEGANNTWYLASCMNIADAQCEMEFLQRVDKSSNLKWKHPNKLDKDILPKNAIISCDIDGEWDVSQDRNMIYTLRNHVYINQVVSDIM